jgi:hypothetical protein
MGLEINSESETEHQETIRKHEKNIRKHDNKDILFDNNLTEKELLQMIAKDTNRTAKNVAFYFWVSMISVAYILFQLFQAQS